MPGWLIPYLGTAAVISGAVVGGVWLLAVLVGRGRDGTPLVPAGFLAVFFLALTQTPLPDPASMICPVPETEPQLHLLSFVPRFLALSPGNWSGDVLILSSGMNLGLCAAIAVALASVWRSGPVIVASVLGLSLLAEFTQLTGFWGLFPCPWRQFDIDDLLLNGLGGLLGFGAARLIGLGPKPVSVT